MSFRVFLLAGLAAGAPAIAAPPPIEAFFNEPAISQVTLSPSGSYVAFLYSEADGHQVIGVRETRDLTKSSVPGSTANADAIITSLHWINDDRIGFTVKNRRMLEDGNWDEFAANRDGSQVTHLISGDWQHRQEKVGSHLQSRLLTAAYGYFGPTYDGSDDIVVEKYLWNNLDLRPESSRLFRLNTKTRELKDLLPGAQPARVRRWLLDTDAVPRIAISQAQGRCTLSYRDKDAAAWSDLGSVDCLAGNDHIPSFFDNRHTLYVTAGYRGHAALFTYDLAKRQRADAPLVSLEGFDYHGNPELDFAAKTVAGLHYQTDAWATVWFDAGMKAVQQKVDALLPGMVNRIHCGMDCRNATALLVHSTSDRQPTQYFVYTPATNKLVGLGSEHPDIRPADMGQRDFHRFKARDGMQVPVYVTLPPGQAKGPHPAVVLVHGGPFVRGASWEWDDEAQFLASRGYVVLQPEFRGSRGYGVQHEKAGWQQWGRAMQDDLADAATWAIQQGWADPKRIAITGASYGGYATLMGLIRNPEIFRCGAEFAGVADIGLMFATPQSDASQESLKYGMKTLIGDPVADAAALAEVSPLAQAVRLTQPLLIAHGGEDRRVPVIHAAKLKGALAHNRAVGFVVYPDEGHGLERPKNRIDYWKRVETLLATQCR